MENVGAPQAEAELSPSDEVALVEAARYNAAAFSTLYRRYVTPVYRYLYKWTGGQAEAEDLTSQVFIEVLDGLAHYQERGTFAAWLFTIARRKRIAAYRRQRPSLPLGEAEDVPGSSEDPLEQVVQGEQRERMAALFASLNDDQRELLYLRFSARLGYAEIGAVVGHSPAAVKMQVVRLLRQMNAKWEEK